jgi:hypothetical protein
VVQRQYNQDFGALVAKAKLVPASQALREADFGEGDIRVYYDFLTKFKTLARQFGIFEDTKVRFSVRMFEVVILTLSYFLC